MSNDFEKEEGYFSFRTYLIKKEEKKPKRIPVRDRYQDFVIDRVEVLKKLGYTEKEEAPQPHDDGEQ